jgi:hypothetical protein
VQSQPTPPHVGTDSQHYPVKAPSHLLHANANPHQSTTQADKAQQSIGDRPHQITSTHQSPPQHLENQ